MVLLGDISTDLLHLESKGRSLQSATRQDLYIPRTFSSFGNRQFSVVAPKLWNKLPKDIKDITSVESFKKYLKTYLFNVAFS